MNKEDKESRKKEEKWKPVHEIAAEILEKPDDPTMDILVITKLYGEKKAKVPLKGIPLLRKALEPWVEKAPTYKERVILALSNLEQQEKEEEAKEKKEESVKDY